jgi:hypothetical protein
MIGFTHSTCEGDYWEIYTRVLSMSVNGRARLGYLDENRRLILKLTFRIEIRAWSGSEDVPITYRCKHERRHFGFHERHTISGKVSSSHKRLSSMWDFIRNYAHIRGELCAVPVVSSVSNYCCFVLHISIFPLMCRSSGHSDMMQTRLLPYSYEMINFNPRNSLCVPS